MKRGYSILEVLVAVSLLAIVLPGLVKWVTSSRQAQIGSFRQEQAAALAQRIVDSLTQTARGNRNPDPSGTTKTYSQTDYLVKWDYTAGDVTTSYSSTKPGQIYVQLDWKSGPAPRTTRILGVLP